jgi:hypothetical protein
MEAVVAQRTMTSMLPNTPTGPNQEAPVDLLEDASPAWPYWLGVAAVVPLAVAMVLVTRTGLVAFVFVGALWLIGSARVTTDRIEPGTSGQPGRERARLGARLGHRTAHTAPGSAAR